MQKNPGRLSARRHALRISVVILLGLENDAGAADERSREPSWLALPVVSISPKLGSAAGAMVGVQGVKSNYTITAEEGQSILEAIGLTGVASHGLGAVVMLDSRDDKIAPRSGWYAQAANFWMKEDAPADGDYEKYRLDIRNYRTVFTNWVLAVQLDGRWSHDAPASAWESVTLRSYTQGQYLAPSVTQVQAELRIPLAKRWRAIAFTGVACLYGDGDKCKDGLYPMIGVGGQYIVHPASGRVANLDVAIGKNDNFGVVRQLGNAF